MTDGLVADLQEGKWSEFVYSQQASGGLHLKAKELLKKLRENNRLRLRSCCDVAVCEADPEWLSEAARSHELEAFQGIITSHVTYRDGLNGSHIQSIERIHLSSWWSERSHSRVLTRSAQDYLDLLTPILRQGNSLMFIDPHIDPNKPRYQTIPQMLSIALNRGPARPKTRIEIHRVCYEERGMDRSFPTESDWVQRFHSNGWNQHSFEVFIWDNFHDRYLISDLCGVQLGAGFDAGVVPVSETTTWTRLDREVRDRIQREFDPVSGIHRLRYRFIVG